jgi:hypothetical protein
MEKNGLRYTSAVDGQEALEAYKSSPVQYQTILMGMYIHLPGPLTDITRYIHASHGRIGIDAGHQGL